MISLDLLLYNARIADVFRMRVFDGWVGIRDGRFVYVEEGAPPKEIVADETRDLGRRVIAPGLIDTHMHIESSLLTPRGFAQAVVPHGTTTVLADPHEVANVAGEEGVRWMIRASQNLPLRIFYAIPSCVPATSPEIEWTRAVFDANTVKRLAQEPSVIALGEVMDYGQVLANGERLRGMVDAAHDAGLVVEGHIPTLSGTDLSQYLAWRITSDHTLATPEKIREQISKGVAVMLQMKSCVTENIAAVNALPDRSRILLVTDDIEPSLLMQGHLSLIVRAAIDAGMSPLEALASATIRPARYLGLRDLGGIAPGFRADFAVLDELAVFPPRQVFVGGKIAAQDGAMVARDLPPTPPTPGGTTLPGHFTRDDFALVPLRPSTPLRSAQDAMIGSVTANAVVITSATTSLTDLARARLRVENGFAQFADDDPLALVAVIARDGSSKSVGIVKDLGLRVGACASSFAHDSHNLLVIGRDADEMRAAANAVREMRGGVVVVRDGAVIARLPLPVFGLLNDAPLAETTRVFESVENALRDLGVQHQRPFLMLSLLALTVSPRFKFSDKGVVDVEARGGGAAGGGEK
ncbi:MAG: adenine deaminase C-terminal domain-containing protein, partial [Chloroflexota bacterium]